ncbi:MULTISPECIES: hypothetical protein [unclassified Moorena]|uniref:hypothetical protein n=1 Tax=unclassified Moorena TaxID=2683338 RepID=UPI0013FF0B7A|nr:MULTISPECIES: hypothetical protein [unclassified Moorena]NEO16323.1 hypothetical protein [Moorena sp. SIO3E8]NEQ02882.1 hypothetical protein [Moorena sp. SIO3F7]
MEIVIIAVSSLIRYTAFFPCSLFPVPCSLFPKNLTQLKTAILSNQFTELRNLP